MRHNAFQSRLDYGIRNLDSIKVNSEAAKNRILDADIAKESADLVRLQILQQSATAVLAQANQTPELVLKLLQQSSG